MYSLASYILLCVTLCCFHIHITKAQPESNLCDNKKYQAVLFDLTRNESGSACPATTEREKKFNNEVSITGRSLFLQIVYRRNEAKENISLDICEKPPQPAMVYDSKQGTYEIGYEFYYEENKIQLEDDKYHCYNSVNINNYSKSSTDFVSRGQDGKNNTKFIFVDGSTTLVFHWISELSINSTGYNKHIKWKKDISVVKNNTLSKCQDYQLDEWGETNISLAMKTGEERSHEVLKKSQIIPLWYFDTYSSRLASCSLMNVILVWKNIVDHLKKVDLFIAAAICVLEKEYSRLDQTVTFGVSGEYELFNYTLDAKHQKIHIAKIIYRLIQGSFYDDTYTAAIIIHNEVGHILDKDRLCNSSMTLSGWDAIKNDDPKVGLTYVCPLTEELKNKLSIGEYFTSPIQLDAIPYSENPWWEDTYPIRDHDVRSEINGEFECLWQRVGIENHHNQASSTDIPPIEKL
ncbi:uncharacterized protein LOC135831751 isoform X2 [Planococcus citri]|uniref:uncharacterized protein LOC135831751 isoform X2 n=1 Tax=Planococcus citri TaxID=170843 RepID=UPI0031F7B4E4